MVEHLRFTDTPTAAAEVLAELLAHDLQEWPDDAWLVVDDYHFAIGSGACESFFHSLVQLAPVRVLLTTRRRPTWASSRSIVYGEVVELRRDDLAMTEAEARKVLRAKPSGQLSDVLSMLDGWPAVIALAALTHDSTFRDEKFPPLVFEYLAEEVYQTLPRELQGALRRLSLAPVITPALRSILLDERHADALVDLALHLGLLTASADATLDMHPLLREYLRGKLHEDPSLDVDAVLSDVVRHLILASGWDEAFAVIDRFCLPALLPQLFASALEDLLDHSRLVTIGKWLEYAREYGVASPAIDLAEAELAFRQGASEKAEALASHLVDQLDESHPIAVRALLLAGTSAHLRDREELAQAYHRRAYLVARTPQERRRALWGHFLAAIELEDEAAASLLDELEATEDSDPTTAIQVAGGRLTLASRFGDLETAIERAKLTAHLLDKVASPVARSSFLNLYADALVTSARYEAAAATVEKELDEIKTHRLTFALPHALLIRGATRIGLREFDAAAADIRQADEIATSSNITYLLVSVRALEIRLHIARGEPEQAVAVISGEDETVATRWVWGQYLALRAMALALVGDYEQARRHTNAVRALTTNLTALSAATWADVVAASRQRMAQTDDLVRDAITLARSTGHIDSLLCAYRACPQILGSLAGGPDEEFLARVFSRAGDTILQGLLHRAHNPKSHGSYGLSKREQEVYNLLAKGLSNREIAQALFIAEPTVKIHVRRIFAKVGARSRTEAALRALSDQRT